MIGEVGKGYRIAIETLNEGRIGIGAQMVGISQGAFTKRRPATSKTREQFWQGHPSEFLGVQFQLSEMRCLLETSRSCWFTTLPDSKIQNWISSRKLRWQS